MSLLSRPKLKRWKKQTWNWRRISKHPKPVITTPSATITNTSTMMPPIAILIRNIATEGIPTHHLHLATMIRRRTINATEQKEKDRNPLMALASGSGDIGAITTMRTISANSGMASKLRTHARSTEDHGTGAPNATAWEIMQPMNTMTATSTLHQIGPRMTTTLHAEYPSYLAGHSAPHGSNLSEESRYMLEDSRWKVQSEENHNSNQINNSSNSKLNPNLLSLDKSALLDIVSSLSGSSTTSSKITKTNKHSIAYQNRLTFTSHTRCHIQKQLVRIQAQASISSLSGDLCSFQSRAFHDEVSF